jgi:hypothetical protein
MRHHVLLALLLLGVPALCGIVVRPGADAATERAPAQVPGWANVGLRAGTSAVYLGNAWVITARHVGIGDVVLGGVDYRAVPDSSLELDGDGSPPLPDVMVFRIEPLPPLPPLRIRPTPPDVGERVVLVGAGRGRGVPTRWGGHSGWAWGPHQGLRWGTNRVSEAGIHVVVGGIVTRAFAMRFDPFETQHEAQAALGDSGGAVFIRREGRFELAGVLIAVGSYPGQSPETSLYGNTTNAADLSVFARKLTALVRGR